MKKPYRQADGFYHVDGKKYKTLFGSREQVMNGTVHKTTGGLTKADLVMNKWGRIVSAKKFKTAKKEMRLQKHGFFAKKGKFGAITRKFRGGNPKGDPTDDKKNAAVAAEEQIKQDNTAATTSVVPTAASTIVDPAAAAPAVVAPAAAPAVVAPATSTVNPPASTIVNPAATIITPGGANSGANKKTRSPPRDKGGNVIYKKNNNTKKISLISEENKNKPK